MALLSKLRGLLSGKNEVVQPTIAANASVAQVKPLETVDFSLPVSQEDKELVAAIASAILVHDDTDVTVQVKSITGIDLEKEIAAAIIGAIAAGDHPASQFRLKSIARID
ncbi:hypothetical protein [Trichococcus collinsii]|jgi:hypothetical protein|uniref:Uncharacterized protein n=1 Tax=Trichococcus collinsii TaxID=157076 RepID=A0AB38A0R3_9LACT|nr:hypothetical protein [Trichococcus collinsii]CZQ89505.1 Hypothetical protein Tcol_922 [Trichococcus collinsii]SEA48810.1 hypothetical protein SAMN04488525_103226 [Trichococcus collinsii]